MPTLLIICYSEKANFLIANSYCKLLNVIFEHFSPKKSKFLTSFSVFKSFFFKLFSFFLFYSLRVFKKRFDYSCCVEDIYTPLMNPKKRLRNEVFLMVHCSHGQKILKFSQQVNFSSKMARGSKRKKPHLNHVRF